MLMHFVHLSMSIVFVGKQLLTCLKITEVRESYQSLVKTVTVKPTQLFNFRTQKSISNSILTVVATTRVLCPANRFR